ncbi:MAG: hypothetical protein ACK53L_11870, partial [Pirellulaceae bacterium]
LFLRHGVPVVLPIEDGETTLLGASRYLPLIAAGPFRFSEDKLTIVVGLFSKVHDFQPRSAVELRVFMVKAEELDVGFGQRLPGRSVADEVQDFLMKLFPQDHGILDPD